MFDSMNSHECKKNYIQNPETIHIEPTVGTIETPQEIPVGIPYRDHMESPSLGPGLIGRSYDDEATQKDKKVLPYKASGQGTMEPIRGFHRFHLWKIRRSSKNTRKNWEFGKLKL